MLPDLTEYGLLPPGIHDATVDEIAELFGRFQWSDKRMKLMDRLRDFLTAAWAVDDGLQVLVDGSFIMAKVDAPDDIDLIVALPRGWDIQADVAPFKYNVVSKRMVRRLFGFDVLIGVDGQAAIAEAIDFFCRVNTKWVQLLGIPVGTSKGI
ncbi:MAG TPA: hypothetical protein VN541_02040, partial [Tepidisphaeraceae bacterium]|nr:hypothetical protein [Tepidisphaeraceae bacterium]